MKWSHSCSFTKTKWKKKMSGESNDKILVVITWFSFFMQVKLVILGLWWNNVLNLLFDQLISYIQDNHHCHPHFAVINRLVSLCKATRAISDFAHEDKGRISMAKCQNLKTIERRRHSNQTLGGEMQLRATKKKDTSWNWW